MRNSNKIITAAIAIIVGIMFIVMKGEVVSLALTLLGIGTIVMGIMDVVKQDTKSGIVKLICGAVVITCGWLFVNVALTIIAVLLIVYCIANLASNLKIDGYTMSGVQKFRTFFKPLTGLVAGICLLFNQGGTVAWAFVITGIIFIANGVAMLSECRNKR